MAALSSTHISVGFCRVFQSPMHSFSAGNKKGRASRAAQLEASS